MSGKPPPEPLVPWYIRAWWLLCAYARWPLDVRQLKREGWRRTGWMTWESPPPEQAPGLGVEPLTGWTQVGATDDGMSYSAGVDFAVVGGAPPVKTAVATAEPDPRRRSLLQMIRDLLERARRLRSK